MLDFRPILFVNGILLSILAVAMLIPMAFDLIEGDADWKIFAISAFMTAFMGGILFLTNRGYKGTLNLRQAFLFTASSWILLSLFGALPLYLSELDIPFVDAVFETVSGLTTTGSTVLVGLDSMPSGLLLWRALTTGIGGIGIVVMALAILPMLQIGGMQLFKTESSDTAGKILPRTTQIAAVISVIFMILVVLCAYFFWLTGMSGFDAICHAFPTVATGGFSTHDMSFAYFDNPMIDTVGIVFMIAGGVPLILYYQMLHGQPLVFWRNSQVRCFLAIIGLVSLILTVHLVSARDFTVAEAVRHSLFNVVSIITTTGFISTDYNAWGNFAICVFFMLTAVGGCTGSTAGGIKIFRFQVLYEAVRVQISRLIHPHGVFIPRYEGKPITDEVSSSVMSFILLWGASFMGMTLGLAATGLDFITSMSGVAQAMANVGPGLGDIIGPVGNFSTLPDTAKWILSFAMILGRLELFTLLILFTPQFWRD